MKKPLLLLLCLGLFTQGEVFMKLGDIEGEVVTEGFEGWCRVASVSLSGYRTITPPDASQRGASVQDGYLHTFKLVDLSSPELFAASLNTGPVDSVEFAFVRLSPTHGAVPYYRMTASNAYVTSYYQGASGAFAYEGLNFLIDEVKHEFLYPTNVTGSASAFAPIPTADPDPVVAYVNLVDGSFSTSGTSGLEDRFPPTLGSLPGTNTLEETPVSVPFTYSDSDSSGTQLVFTVQSLSTSIVSAAGLQIIRSSSNGTVVVTPLPEATGLAQLRLTVSDGTDEDQVEFLVNVISTNDTPQLAPIAGQTITTAQSLQLQLQLSDVDTPIDQLTLTGTSSDTNLLASSNILFSGTSSIRTLDLITEGLAGVLTIDISVSDGETSDSRSFVLLINDAASGAPSNLTPVPNPLQVLENSTNGTLIGNVFVTDTTPGGDTFTQSLSDDADGRFSAGSFALHVADGSKLDYETSTSHPIVFTVVDSSGLVYSEFLTVNVLPTNEAPTVTASETTFTAFTQQDRSLPALSLADQDAGSGDVLLYFQALNGTITVLNPPAGVAVVNNGSSLMSLEGSIDELNAIVATSGQLQYNSFPNFSGSDSISITLDDQGLSGPGGSKSAGTSLSVQVYAHLLHQWQVNFFGADRDNPALEATVWGLDADFDNDKLPNLVEYALGLDPTDGQSVLTWENLIIDQVNRQVFVRVPELQDPRVTVQVEVSSVMDPSGFSSAPAEIQLVAQEGLGGGLSQLTFLDQKDPDTDPQRFYRLNVTYTP